MPLYFFHLHGHSADVDGHEFPDDETARDEARAVARELVGNSNIMSGKRLIVRDEDGSIVHEEPL
jgi:hypothetical protein